MFLQVHTQSGLLALGTMHLYPVHVAPKAVDVHCRSGLLHAAEAAARSDTDPQLYATAYSDPTVKPTFTAAVTFTATITATLRPTAAATQTYTPEPEAVAATSAPVQAVPAVDTLAAGINNAGLPDWLANRWQTWFDIQVMPGAIAGAEQAGSYTYSTDATAGQIQDYYNGELPRLGWVAISTGLAGVDPAVLSYAKGLDAVIITITGSATVTGKTLVVITF